MVYRYAERKELNNADRCMLRNNGIMEEAGITVVVWSGGHVLKVTKPAFAFADLSWQTPIPSSRTSPRSTDDFCTTTAWWTLRLLEQGSKLIALPIN